MKKTSLVVLAAGMGSRYGGLKQIDKIGPNGEIILELSIYDAIQAGFDEVVFIIKHSIEKEFKAALGDEISKHIDVKYVYQDLDNIPEGFEVPSEREKPWGTGHALLCCKEVVNNPFCVINSDDYYGREAFVKMHDFLVNSDDDNEYAMVAYHLENTISENGSVSRGACQVEDHLLVSVNELTSIEKHGEVIEYLDQETWKPLANNTPVSLNFWGFKASFIDKMMDDFVEFFQNEVPQNIKKSEFFIPKEVDKMVKAGDVQVKVLESKEKWYGVTYQEDKPKVKAGIEKLINENYYPTPLWK